MTYKAHTNSLTPAWRQCLQTKTGIVYHYGVVSSQLYKLTVHTIQFTYVNLDYSRSLNADVQRLFMWDYCNVPGVELIFSKQEIHLDISNKNNIICL